jgi:hypothetical protein
MVVPMFRLARMKGLIFGAALVTLTLPSTALAAGTVSGATHAVIRAITEERGSPSYWRTQASCRSTAPSRFGCSFSSTVAEGPYAGDAGPSGRVTVTYTHRHYYVGEPRYNAPREYGPIHKPCDITPGGC